MNTTNVALGVLRAMYATYIGIALFGSRSRERFIARKRRHEFHSRNKAVDAAIW
jgi:hypothetical protein